MYQLREYQEQAVAAAISRSNGICVLPTGSGKSLCVAGIVAHLKNRTLVLQPTKEILESNFEKIQAFGFHDAKIFSASLNSKEVGECTYATIGSVMNKRELFQGTKTLIIDEAHLVNSKGGQYQELIEFLQPERLIGLTATPYRLHSTSLGSDVRMISRTRPKMFDEIIYVAQTGQLIRKGFLHQPEYFCSELLEQSELVLNSTGAEFTEVSVSRFLQRIDIVQLVVEAAKKALKEGSKHILIFLPSLRESAFAVTALNNCGIAADSVDGETPNCERERKLALFKSGKIIAMVNCQVLTTGYDFPALDCIILARPTLSLALNYQMIGRCVRVHESKKRALVYDLVGNFARFGDPMQYHIGESSPGLHAVLSPKGRLTGRIIGNGHECDEKLSFGKYVNRRLCEVPIEYLNWYLRESKKSALWHMIKFEVMRREIFYNQERMGSLADSVAV